MSSNTPLPSSFDGNTEFYEESRPQKFFRRLKEEPLLPLGCAATTAAIVGATRSIRRGDHHRTQRMFRLRILCQAFTLVAMVAGSMYWDADRKKRKEFEDAMQERKNQEKHEAWVRELELRDEEEKEIIAQRERRRARREGRREELELKARIEDAKEKGEEKGKGVLESVYEIMGFKSSPKREDGPETKPKASSTVEPGEERRIGVSEMVQDLVNNKRN